MTEPSGKTAARRWPVLLLALPAFAVLVALGLWQLDRLAWKRALIAELAERSSEEPLPLPDPVTDPEALEFRPIRVTGRFLHDRELYLGARTHQGASGFEVVTPFLLTDGRTLLINRGWTPPDAKAPEARAKGLVPGEVELVGLARLGGWKGMKWLEPANDPAGNLWIWLDLPAMAAAAKLERPVTELYLAALPGQHPGRYPLGGATRLELRNDHLQYALTWFSLAGILLVITLILIFRRPRSARG